MTQLSTHDILKLNEKELVSAIKTMPDEELEQHALGLMEELGGNDYSGLMKTVMKELENDMTNAERYVHIQNVLRDALPNKAHMSDIYERLASMIMLIIMRKYKQILSGK